MIAYCGLNCSLCDAFVATRDNDDARRKATAEKWSQMYRAAIAQGEINCDGCKSNGIRFFHCQACEIRQCCISKKVEHCAACENYICDTLAAFIKLSCEAGKALAQLRP